MIIYIDSDFKCYVDNHNGEYRKVEADFFDGKCETFIEGYRFVPAGESWIREDGAEFKGVMITPWIDYYILDQAQRKYEQELAEAARILMGV